MHWPFCAKVCPYCDFTVTKVRDIDAQDWADALCADLRLLAGLAEPRPLASIYFGGGTPSLMPMRVAEQVFACADDLFGLVPMAEITIEANPDDAEQLATFKSAGFNRLSLGVQSLDDRELTFLGRNHSADQARKAIETATATFNRVSVDLMYALPDQKLSAWEQNLSKALALGPDHFSIYQLTIEPETAFGKRAQRGTLKPLCDDRSAEFYEHTQDITTQLGFPAYEVSSHARPGAEAVHNANYWADADWLAIGPGAHGRLGPATRRIATEGLSNIRQYTALPPEKRLRQDALSLFEHRLEVLGSGLRPISGLRLDRLGEAALAVREAARGFIDDGLLAIDAENLRATEAGRLLIDYIATELSTALDDS
ncbi:MAG: radical SAM family heme chaperone HemW [Pseudomonadota bacterium]